MPRYWFAPFLCIALALGAVCDALAQEPTSPAQRFADIRARLTETALEQLRSGDPLVVAWGAHTAAEFRLTKCIRELKAQLAAQADAPRANFTALAILDALIQTGGEVKGDAVKPFVTGITTPSALTLLLPKAEDNLALFLTAYRDRYDAMTWWACGDVLAAARHSEFALELLREPMTAVLGVYDHMRLENDEVGLGGCTGCVKLQPPKGYPPCVQYDVATRTRCASEWLVDAARDYMSPRLAGARTRWLREMLGKAADSVVFDLTPTVAVEWSSLEELHAVEREQREALAAAQRKLIALCVEERLVTKDVAAALEPSIKFWWMDYREDPTVPLPADKDWMQSLPR